MKIIPDHDSIAIQLRQHLKTGGDWESLLTPIPGISIVRVPPSKSRSARLVVEVNPAGEIGTPRKRRGLLLVGNKMRLEFLEILRHPDLPRLFQALNIANVPAGKELGVKIQKPLKLSAPPKQSPPPTMKSTPRIIGGSKVPAFLPDFDLAVAERGTISARASRVLRVSERAVLAVNAVGREIWIPKMALTGDSVPPAAPQDALWVFSVKGWFIKKRDFQVWLQDGS